MSNLNDIISTFSSEDQHRFTAYLDKKNKRSDAKNIQLFNYLLNDNLDSNEICLKLYGSLKKDAYHALRKRLYQSIIDFIANNSIQEENSIDMQIIKYILASRSFLYHKQYKVAYKVLDKAEVLASEHYLFPLLNEIYHTKIQYAYTNPSISINELISKFKANQKNHQLEDQLNMVYAKIKHTLNNITYKGDVIDFQTVLNQTLQEHNISINESMSFKSLYQLTTIASISAFVTKDYLQIEPFLINTYNIIITHKNKEKQPFYHIEIIYQIANTLFRNKKFNASFRYLESMHKHMLLKQKKYYTAYKLKYNLLIALNHNYSNKQSIAIETLEPLITTKHPDTESLLDIYLSLIMFYFQKNDLKKTHTLFSKFYHTDHWYTEKAGKEWVIKKNLIEILLHIDLKNIDLVESRLLSFKRNYYDYLKSINQQRVITYLGFVESYYKTPEAVTSTKFKNTVSQSFDWIDIHKEDIFVISFYSWLKGKMNNEDLYTTTLNLITQSQQELTNT
ncbi:hypothetical protein Q4Q34_03515 [Flavivirga abyssicola]|uniref:hypothetical protein n=1 Tax=Flavivirga abyssicola TaxID=3063533 RepID=UPI0026DEB633|nr:hypothetical protein [Flavivirga sp. MEBiC07777]WVK14097.1 hypothetical protein Q4Q34_03515 [Flavivirga sp. MEBiC07777]